jgi:hypothetical protein
MRRLIALLIVSIFIFYSIPLTLSVDVSTDSRPVILTLDLCHKVDAPLKTGAECSWINAPVFETPFVRLSYALREAAFILFDPFTAPPEEKPPRVA